MDVGRQRSVWVISESVCHGALGHLNTSLLSLTCFFLPLVLTVCLTLLVFCRMLFGNNVFGLYYFPRSHRISPGFGTICKHKMCFSSFFCKYFKTSYFYILTSLRINLNPNFLKLIFIIFFPLPFISLIPPPPSNHHTVAHVHESSFLFAQSLHLLISSSISWHPSTKPPQILSNSDLSVFFYCLQLNQLKKMKITLKFIVTI